MSMIKYNLATKEITIEGPESFMDDSFDVIKESMTTSFRRDKQQGGGTRPRDDRPVIPSKAIKPEITAIPAAKRIRRRRKQQQGTPNPDASQAIAPEIPPVRKYILRKAGAVSKKEPIGDPATEGIGKVSIESLKERLGVTEEQISGILREAEKQGRVRREADGSYIWV
jgi:hypothetical protein